MTTIRKRLISIRSEINLEINTVRFTAFDNVKEAIVPGMDFRFEGTKFYPEIVNLPEVVRHAVLDGCSDSIRDAGALGAESTVKQKFDAMRERSDYLETGPSDWSRGRVQGEGTILLEALMLKFPEADREKIRGKLNGMTASQKRKLEFSDELREFVDKVRAQRGRAVKQEEVDELLAELDV